MIPQLLADKTKREGLNRTGIAGVELYSSSDAVPRCATTMTPVMCFVGQGRKNIYVGETLYQAPGMSLLMSTIKIPIDTELLDVSSEAPYLGLVIHIDPVEVSQILIELNQIENEMTWENTDTILCVEPINDDIGDAVERLLEIIGNPMDEALLGRTRLREIYYSILKSPAGNVLRNCAIKKSKASAITRIIQHLEDHFHESINIDDLVQISGMSSSVLHESFKKITSLSPIQFLKRTRLNHGHNLLLNGSSVSDAALKSGYNSSTQFSREFKQLFGVPPSKVSGEG